MLFRKAKRRQTEKNAERILAQSFDTLRSHQPGETTPMSFLATRLKAKAAQQDYREDSLMSRVARIFTARPKLSASMLAAVAVVLFVALVPFSYTITAGYTVAFEGVNDKDMARASTIAEALSAMGYDNVWANFNDDGTGMVCTLAGLPDRQAAQAAASVYRNLTGTQIEPTISPVVVQKSGSLYAQVRDHFVEFSICIDEAASPEEIEAQVIAQLTAMGINATNVKVITDEEDGSVMIQLEIGE